MYYHLMYPNDVDICVPYVAPMCYGIDDDRARDYVKELAADETLRKQVLNFKQRFFDIIGSEDSTKFCKEYCKQWKAEIEPKDYREQILNHLASLVIRFDVDYWNEDSNWVFEILPYSQEEYKSIEWMVNWFAKLALSKEGINSFTYTDFINPAELYQKGSETKAVFIDVDTNNNKDKDLPYYYMALKEQGYVLACGVNDLKVPEKWKDFCTKECAPSTKDNLFILKGFDPKDLPDYSSELYEQCISYYQNHDDKIIFIYGENDYWTGCGINDVWKDIRTDRKKYPTFGFEKKQNMKYYLVPGKGHSAEIRHLPQDKQTEIWTQIDKWIEEASK